MMHHTDNSGQVPSREFPRLQFPGSGKEKERRDAAENRQQILVAAQVLFNEHGIEQVTMRQIAIASHVGQGTLYRRFPNKGLLCQALLVQNLEYFQNELLLYFEQTETMHSISEQIEHMLIQLMHFTEKNAHLLGAMEDAFAREHRSQSYQSPFYRWLRAVTMILLQRGIAQHEFPEQDVEYVADVLLAAFAIDFYHYQRYTLGFSQQRIIEGMRHFLLGSLKTS